MKSPRLATILPPAAASTHSRSIALIQREIGRAFVDGSPPIRVRIGVHTGDAVHEGDDFFGTTVRYAARVAGHSTATSARPRVERLVEL
jgi:class 3 adenylate cyclase